MIHYECSSSEKVQNLEEALAKELKDLKDEIEETDMLYGNWSKPIRYVMLSCPFSTENVLCDIP